MHRKIHSGVIAAALLLAAAAARAGDAAPAAAPAAGGSGKVNINQASAEQLSLLPRIGEKVAERIVAYRKEHGTFGRPEQLMEVKGIGEKLFLVLKPYVTVSGPTTVTEKIRSGSFSSSSSSRGRAGTAAKKPPSSTAPVGKGR
jgi:competence protein ComEA